MAQTIQLKRGTGSAVPSSLSEGELALNVDSGKLYYGQTSTSASNNFHFNHITASGNISSSGEIKANTLHVVSTSNFADDITIGDTKKIISTRLIISASNNTSFYGDTSITGGDLSLNAAGSVLDVQGQGDATDASGDTGAIRTNGGISIAKKAFIGTDLNIGGSITSNITASGNISASGYIQTETLKGAGSTTGLEVSGYVSASTEVLGSTGSFNVMTKAMAIELFGYAISSYHTSELYIPLAGTTSDGTADSYLNRMAAPYDGTVKRISMMYQTQHPGNGHIVRVRAASDMDIDDADDIVETITRNSISHSVMHHFDFSSSFNKGDTLGFTVEAPNLPSSNTYVYGTITFEFDTSS
jgi:hypothetical protein